jgi:RHH-type transcriptional regulator, proline utilization regulon repressor / proline dehydrogenase / delta 1-pyrroline-5-carboxylate dehydrogenase
MEIKFDRSPIDANLFLDETTLVHALAKQAKLSAADDQRVLLKAKELVLAVRNNRKAQGSIDAFMQEYSLSSQEGVVLMCLAEALLRIPDAATADRLIADKIVGGNWQTHLGKSESLFVNASAWGLMLTGKIITMGQDVSSDGFGFLKRLVHKSGEPILRNAIKQAMRIMGRQFVLGQDMGEALKFARPEEAKGYRFSFDMLGESAMTMADAEHYFRAYQSALGALVGGSDVFVSPSLSVKLSALYPRYEEKHRDAALAHLFYAVLRLAVRAKELNVGLTFDAEEVARLDISLALFERLATEPQLAGWNGLGLAVQAYGKRALAVLEWLADLAEKSKRVLPVRLVKGAYWDTEIKRAQEAGLEDFPVFTRKVCTDVSYLACARFMLSRREVFYPQFATHNAQTVAAVLVMAGDARGFEFQRLHGMGQGLYDQVIEHHPCRIYAPVGSHKDLLAYLVRRLLENGANTSFVNRLADDAAPLDEIVVNPVDVALALKDVPHPRILKPSALFGPRLNSAGLPLWRASERQALTSAVEDVLKKQFEAAAIVEGQMLKDGPDHQIASPQQLSMKVGRVWEASEASIIKAMERASICQQAWDELGGSARAEILERAAGLFENHRAIFVGLLVREAGKTLDNALGDLRESVDFLRFYASEARAKLSIAVRLPGPTGEINELTLHGRGVFACISPWNFPLAIFTGQVAAALAAGNAVVAKPAEQTPLIAFEAVKLLHQAGVPVGVLHFLPGDGARIGKVLLNHPCLAGVAFTGSNDTARIINRMLAMREGSIPSFVAETGGMNAIIVDSSALPEQAVRDVVYSAFDSAGQRCSAARILFVQEDIADGVIEMLTGAMKMLRVGDPLDYSTDVGPVIDVEAKRALEDHKAHMARDARVILDLPLPSECAGGNFVSPAAYELNSIELLSREVFGPILHVVRFKGDQIDAVCDQVNAMGFGLTFGLHTRIESVAKRLRAQMRVGNMYVNRNQIGAVVGAQPFGGEGLSGTGPKAGGPHTLTRFTFERICSIDSTASGGNAELINI